MSAALDLSFLTHNGRSAEEGTFWLKDGDRGGSYRSHVTPFLKKYEPASWHPRLARYEEVVFGLWLLDWLVQADPGNQPRAYRREADTPIRARLVAWGLRAVPWMWLSPYDVNCRLWLDSKRMHRERRLSRRVSTLLLGEREL